MTRITRSSTPWCIVSGTNRHQNSRFGVWDFVVDFMSNDYIHPIFFKMIMIRSFGALQPYCAPRGDT